MRDAYLEVALSVVTGACRAGGATGSPDLTADRNLANLRPPSDPPAGHVPQTLEENTFPLL